LEKKNIKAMRQSQVHKAQPIRHYEAVRIQPSDKALTHPESPMIGKKRQAKSGSK
jgi:hypothetical protein